MQIEQNRTTTAKREAIAALKASLGIVTVALDKCDVSRTQFYQWLKDDEVFKSQVDEISEMAIDFAETHLLKSIKNGSDTATIFYLKTKGKKRGYVEKSEIELSGIINVLHPDDE